MMAKALREATTPERISVFLLQIVTPSESSGAEVGEGTGALVGGDTGALVGEGTSTGTGTGASVAGVCPAVQLDSSSGGNRTASITWTTPLLASMSAIVTLATPLITTSPSTTSMHNSDDSNKVETAPGTMSELMTLALTTWYNRVPTMISASGKFVPIRAKRLSKAASVGAKTVKASLVFKASVNPYVTTKSVSSR